VAFLSGHERLYSPAARGQWCGGARRRGRPCGGYERRMEGQDEVSAREQHFHSQVRESTICFLLFAILYIVSYFIIIRYKRKSDEQEDEDAVVNRISLFLSTFTLAVSAGAVLLLPFSIISNEILLAFPHNYYIQWLNGSLIHVLKCCCCCVLRESEPAFWKLWLCCCFLRC
ncbi:limb region 1, isoform CRA_a, partial [Mus musculus]